MPTKAELQIALNTARKEAAVAAKQVSILEHRLKDKTDALAYVSESYQDRLKEAQKELTESKAETAEARDDVINLRQRIKHNTDLTADLVHRLATGDVA